jgi:hypothetical protein
VVRIFAWRRGVNAMHLIDRGVRLGLFQSLVDSPDGAAAELAARHGLRAPHVRVWCTTASGFGLLDAGADSLPQSSP